MYASYPKMTSRLAGPTDPQLPAIGPQDLEPPRHTVHEINTLLTPPISCQLALTPLGHASQLTRKSILDRIRIYHAKPMSDLIGCLGMALPGQPVSLQRSRTLSANQRSERGSIGSFRRMLLIYARTRFLVKSTRFMESTDRYFAVPL